MKIAEQLIAKEIEILADQKRRDFSTVEALLADDFHEIGGSGRLYSKPEVMQALPEIQVMDYPCEDFQVLFVGAECAIVVFKATVRRVHRGQAQSTRAYRSSTWVKRDGAWRLVFHQATPLAAP